ncbi:Olfactory receptor 14A2, partial [Ophiophagus hannah]
MVILVAFFLDSFIFAFIFASYIHIFSAVMKIPTTQSRHKVFSTCTPHLTVFSLFIITAVFSYMRPNSLSTPVDLLSAVLYTALPPFTYGSIATRNSDTMPPSFYCMVPNDVHQYLGIIQLLQYFGWTWVGLSAVDDDSGEYFLEMIEQLFYQNSICSAFTKRIPKQASWNIEDRMNNIYEFLTHGTASTYIVYDARKSKDFCEQVFNCEFPKAQEPMGLSGICTGKERLQNLPGSLFELFVSGHMCSIYSSVYTI